MYWLLNGVAEKLPADKFIGIHRSFTIGLDNVNVIEGNCVEIDGKLIPISREQAVLKKIYKWNRETVAKCGWSSGKWYNSPNNIPFS